MVLGVHQVPVGRAARSRNKNKVDLSPAVASNLPPGMINDKIWKLTDREVMQEYGFNPVVEAVKRYYDPNTPERARDCCHKLLADRWSPELKQVEVIGEGRERSQPIHINIIAPGNGQQGPTITISKAFQPQLSS